jgi:hypothetical protein
VVEEAEQAKAFRELAGELRAQRCYLLISDWHRS